MRLIAVLVALTIALPVLAQTQLEMTSEAAGKLNEVDRRLNEVYRALVAKLPSDDATKLREAQLTWIRFRDQECVFETMGSAGGSVHRMVEMQCQAILT